MAEEAKNNRLSRHFSPADVVCQIPAADYDDALTTMVHHLVESHGLENAAAIKTALQERAAEASCRISPAIALPHARLPGLSGIAMCMATSETGLRWNESEAPEIKLVILILAPHDEPALYLQALAAVSRVCQDESAANRIAALHSAGDVWNYFDRSGEIHDVVTAQDVMRPVEVSLRESDTLQAAIDAFVEHRLIEIPVVDKDGDFVGVVSAGALLKICLPDYILWVDDVQPIVNFEPFADVLRHEGSTWLSEILSDEYAVAQDDVPAMQVARQIARYDTSCAYILRDRRLVGIVTLEHFLNKVMRE